MTKKGYSALSIAATWAATLLCLFAPALAQAQQPTRARFDVTNYRIEAQLLPDQHLLRAGAEVTFTPLDATRSVIFRSEERRVGKECRSRWLTDHYKKRKAMLCSFSCVLSTACRCLSS